MAQVVITRNWPDGDSLEVIINVDESFPDAVAEAKRACLDAYREALGVTVAEVDE